MLLVTETEHQMRLVDSFKFNGEGNENIWQKAVYIELADVHMYNDLLLNLIASIFIIQHNTFHIYFIFI